MITVKNFELLNHLVNPPQEKECAVCLDTGKVFQYLNGEWCAFDSSNAKFDISLYELNKTFYKSKQNLTFNELQEVRKKLQAWVEQTDNKYYMLLNKELADYTVFVRANCGETVEKEFISIMYDRGEIKAVEINDDEAWVQFWIETDNGNIYMYSCFPYDAGVIECQ